MVIDTETATRRLVDAGFDEGAAAGLAHVVVQATEGLATDATMADLREVVARLEGKVDSSADELRGESTGNFAELRADIAEFKAESDKRMDGLEQRIDGLEKEVAGLRTQVGELETQVGGLEKQVAELRGEVVASEARLETKIADGNSRMYRGMWMQAAGILVGVAAIVGALVTTMQAAP